MKIIQTNQFKKDLKKQLKRGKDRNKLFDFLECLVGKDEIPLRYNDHPLSGNWAGRRDAHLEPDWILIYKIDAESVVLERTGTHSDLF